MQEKPFLYIFCISPVQNDFPLACRCGFAQTHFASNWPPGNSKKGQEYMKRIEEYKHNKEKSHEDKVNTKD